MASAASLSGPPPNLTSAPFVKQRCTAPSQASCCKRLGGSQTSTTTKMFCIQGSREKSKFRVQVDLRSPNVREEHIEIAMRICQRLLCDNRPTLCGLFGRSVTFLSLMAGDISNFVTNMLTHDPSSPIVR